MVWLPGVTGYSYLEAIVVRPTGVIEDSYLEAIVGWLPEVIGYSYLEAIMEQLSGVYYWCIGRATWSYRGTRIW